MKNLKDEIERIINGIGSPYGEGASYNRLASYDRERDGKLSHLEDYEIEELTKDITSLIEQEREKALREFAEWIDREEKRSYEDTIRLEQVYRFLKESEGRNK